MNTTSIKICGLQSVEVLKSMIHLPIDYIGFLFAESRRRIDEQRATELIHILDDWKSSRPSSVGVFVNPEEELLYKVMAKAPLDVVQLHGQESPEQCRRIKENFPVQVFKVMSIRGNLNDHNSPSYPLDEYVGAIDGLLLDTYDPLYGGGSGKTFAWERIPEYQVWTRRQGIPLFVAGGLVPENVAELVAQYSPDGLDVSSGVETDGIKDIAKITAFVERVKKA